MTKTVSRIAAALVLLFAAPALAEVKVYDSPDVPAGFVPQETPSLAQQVESGDLSPVGARLPKDYWVVELPAPKTAGRSGGTLNTLVARAKDTQLLVVYGYARLVAYRADLGFEADIVKRLEVEDGRIFTFTLRRGHRWSDGHPFTSEDFRFYWEDVANNEEVSPTGPPRALVIDGELPKVEILDEITVRYSWSKPNPFFLPSLAGARPEYIYQPAHYLKQFHAGHADADELAALVKANKKRNWAALYNSKDKQYRNDNPELPSLQPWVNTTAPPAQRFVAARNPYFHRVAAAGEQLPYLDRFILNVAGSSLIPAKTGAGESDLQSRGLSFSDYTFLKANEKRSAYTVRLWRTVRGSQIALYPNLNVNDPVWRKLMRDVRFRRALSLAINRHELNQVIYFGLGLEGNQSVLPESPLYKPEYREAYAQYDPAEANRLLDELGLDKRNSAGIRLLPDGRPLDIIVETAGENTEEVDLLELISDTWRGVGVKLFTKPSQREIVRNRIFSGEAMMSMWFGYENSNVTAEMSPAEFAPVSQHGYQWPKWGQYYETSGLNGAPIDMPKPHELFDLYEEWRKSDSLTEKRDIWQRMLQINANQVYTLGLVAQIPQPVVVSNHLHNVPQEAMYNWDPGALFGIYRPDTFWLDEK
ncbi:MAG: ABC transporter substrate-binding protein [Pseudomonadota bacterium]